MAKVQGPLMSLSASGQIGRSLVFFSLNGKNIVRQYCSPKAPRTPATIKERAYMLQANWYWHYSSRVLKSMWIDYVFINKIQLSVYDYFIQRILLFQIGGGNLSGSWLIIPAHV